MPNLTSVRPQVQILVFPPTHKKIPHKRTGYLRNSSNAYKFLHKLAKQSRTKQNFPVFPIIYSGRDTSSKGI
jgi:hypothetical protein